MARVAILSIAVRLLAACGGDDGTFDAGPDGGSTRDGAMPVDGAMRDAPARDAAAEDASAGEDGGGGTIALPPANGMLDYQLGGAYTPPAGVVVVSRDRTASPAPGIYNICYVNGFQTQSDERSFWLTEHPELLLRDASGDP